MKAWKSGLAAGLLLMAMAQPAFAQSGTMDVIGTDNRAKLPAANPYPYPLRALVYIEFTRGATKARCTGFLVSHDLVVTAGRCVAPGKTGTFYDKLSYRLYPGVRGTNLDWTKGVCKKVLTATKLFASAGWLKTGAEGADYGAIRVSCPVGKYLGFLRFVYTTNPDATVNGLPVAIVGYPSDKPGRFLWGSFDGPKNSDGVDASDRNLLFYENDTSAGETGAPIGTPAIPDCKNCVLGINTMGRHGTGNHKMLNHGVRVRKGLVDEVFRWVSAP
jgi:glutamyl endopeptidase